MAKCRKCKQLEGSDKIVHLHETHGMGYEYLKTEYPDGDWEWINILNGEHNKTGKEGKFKEKFK